MTQNIIPNGTQIDFKIAEVSGSGIVLKYIDGENACYQIENFIVTEKLSVYLNESGELYVNPQEIVKSNP